MKKFIYLFATVLLVTSMLPTQKAEACSWAPGTPPPPTRQEILNAGGKISIVKPLDSGEVVVAEVQNYPVIMTLVAIPTQYVVLEGNQTSCSTGFNFSSSKYYVVVTSAANTFIIRHHEGGSQFSTGYNTMSEAQAAYDALVSGQNPNPPIPNPTGYTPVGYTLKYGMRGNDVRALQQALANFNYIQTNPTLMPVAIPPITVDGVYGNQTVVAVKFFQSYVGLKPVDGIAGYMTQTFLSNYGISVPTAQ